MESMVRGMLVLGLLAGLSGCGVAYNQTSVKAGSSEAGSVRVMQVTPETVLIANRSDYTPRTLPAYFSQVAGAGRGASAAPAPAFERQTRPTTIQTILPPAPPAGAYRIGVGDVVLLATPKAGTTVEQLSGLLAAQNSRQGYTVQDDGAISIPDIGRVQISGQTVEEAEATLFQAFLNRQIDPTFSLEIAEFNARKATIGGAVMKPGSAPIALAPLYLDQALANAGGVSAPDPDYVVVRIYREGRLYQVPLTEVYSRSENARIPLAAGDSVFVDTDYDLDMAAAYFEQQIKLGAYRQGELAALQTQVALRRAELQEQRDTFAARLAYGAEKRDYVYLAGELPKQGRFELPFDERASLADAIYATAGGLSTKSSNPGQLYVLRGSPNPLEYAGITAWHLDVRNAAGLVLATRFEMRPNDVIFVAAQPITHWNNVVNSITPSLLTASVDAISN